MEIVILKKWNVYFGDVSTKTHCNKGQGKKFLEADDVIVFVIGNTILAMA